MKYIFIAATLFFFSCGPTKQATTDNNTVSMPQNISLNGKLFSALFQQRAAEYRALCLQGYNMARWRLASDSSSAGLPKAIITDIDETILDNSPYAVHQALQGKEYIAADWYDWTGRAAADTMPGAAALLGFASSKGITVFYITNRDERERAATLKNLQRFGLPNADNSHLLMRSVSSSKEARRRQVMQQYDVRLLMGDNLADFSAFFDKKSEAERSTNVDVLSASFGQKFIIFPNANYGDWESSLYRYRYDLSQAQKDSVMKAVLKNY